jgi:hypothetical protein
VTWLFAVLAIAVVAAVFLAVLGLLGELPPVEPDLRPDELDGQPAFDVVIRGYRMDEVDDQLGRMQAEIDRLVRVRDENADPALDAALDPENDASI